MRGCGRKYQAVAATGRKLKAGVAVPGKPDEESVEYVGRVPTYVFTASYDPTWDVEAE